ncbi:hypothetical protein OUZ56_000789 [Daphnia magna]|uniref:Uncharacterized protein n=1 Tax=Daphnia magna TaxID=35525 RepID=A0ABR0A1E9_9CRUS|nr:hypothetical protein OUZ56_000789 [Daphnia magna]
MASTLRVCRPNQTTNNCGPSGEPFWIGESVVKSFEALDIIMLYYIDYIGYIINSGPWDD